MWSRPCLIRKCAVGTCRQTFRCPARWQHSGPFLSAPIPPALLERARALAAEHSQLSNQLDGQYDTEVAKKVGSISSVAESWKSWEKAYNVRFPSRLPAISKTTQGLSELQQMIKAPSTDSELRSLASEDLPQATRDLEALSNDLKKSLIPVHPFAHLPCLLELRPGAGGDEAALFASDLLRMYQAYCKSHGLQCKVLSIDSAPSAGAEDQIQEAVIEILSPSSYERFRGEAGVHRVQRVPATETKGRTHTSAVSVLVLPSFPNEVAQDNPNDFNDPSSDYYVNPQDVRTDTMRASGAGGQHVNTTDSAIRLTHIPTGTVVSMQESRSQHSNRTSAWQLLRARLAQARRETREEEMAAMRINAGVRRTGRGDKIRTYNWQQQRVTDHRSGITLNRLDDVLEGGSSLDEIMTGVKEWLASKDLEAMIVDEEAASKQKV